MYYGSLSETLTSSDDQTYYVSVIQVKLGTSIRVTAGPVTRCMMISVPLTPVPVTPVVTRPCHSYFRRHSLLDPRDSVYVASRSDSPVDMHLRRASSELVCTGDSSSSHRDSFGGKSDRKLVDPVDQHRRTSDLLVVPNRE